MNDRSHSTSHVPHGSLSAHMRALEIHFPCSRAELKTAYRQQMLRWHPDRHNHSPATAEAANRRAQAINAAYEEFSRLLDIMELPSIPEPPPRRPSGSPQPGFPGYGEEELEEVMLKSSNLFSAGHDPFNRRLFVKFRDGSIYSYEDVRWGVFRDLVTAKSPGRYFQQNIRNKHFWQRHEPVTR